MTFPAGDGSNMLSHKSSVYRPKDFDTEPFLCTQVYIWPASQPACMHDDSREHKSCQLAVMERLYQQTANLVVITKYRERYVDRSSHT